MSADEEFKAQVRRLLAMCSESNEQEIVFIEVANDFLDSLKMQRFVVKKIRRFKVRWKTGTETYLEGFDIADAMNRAGYGRGSASIIESYEEVLYVDV